MIVDRLSQHFVFCDGNVARLHKAAQRGSVQVDGFSVNSILCCLSKKYGVQMVHSSLAHSIRWVSRTLWRNHFRCLKILNISPRQPRVKHYTSLLFYQKFQNSSDYSAARALFDPLKQRKAASLAVTSKSRHHNWVLACCQFSALAKPQQITCSCGRYIIIKTSHYVSLSTTLKL